MQQSIATFAAGCFWGVEAIFAQLDGVLEVISGYTGGEFANPTYEQVCTGNTGHAEAVQIIFDSSKIDYEKLLEVFWNNHNPTTLNRQGPDVGTQYRSAIFYHTPEQKAKAEQSKEVLEQSGKWATGSIVTQIVPAARFYPAEEYHQKYFAKRGIEPTCHI